MIVSPIGTTTSSFCLTEVEKTTQGADLNNADAQIVQDQENPHHLKELLDNKLIHLYDHLIRMRKMPNRNARKDFINQMTLSELCFVILEARQAIINKVESSIPRDQKEILFILGSTGSGKTTTLCFLSGG